MQLCPAHQKVSLPHAAAARHSKCSQRPTRCPRLVITRYQDNPDASHVSLDDVSSAPRTSQVSAEDTYAAAVANMPEGAWDGRWERWAPPAQGFRGGLFRPDDAESGWQLLTSGVALVERVGAHERVHCNVPQPGQSMLNNLKQCRTSGERVARRRHPGISST